MSNCIFCKIIAGIAKSWKVYEDTRVYAFLDINPVNSYHLLTNPAAGIGFICAAAKGVIHDLDFTRPSFLS